MGSRTPWLLSREFAIAATFRSVNALVCEDSLDIGGRSLRFDVFRTYTALTLSIQRRLNISAILCDVCQ